MLDEIETKLANWLEINVPFALWNRSIHNELFPTEKFAEIVLYDENKNRLGKIVARQDSINANLKTCWVSPLEVYNFTNGTMGVENV